MKETADEGEKLVLLQEGLSKAITEFISIAFERAEVNDLISNQPEFKHLQFLDPDVIFSAEKADMNSAKIMSLISNLQETVTTLLSKSDKKTDLADQLVNRLEKVFMRLFGP